MHLDGGQGERGQKGGRVQRGESCYLTLSQNRAEVPGNLRGQPPLWGRELRDTTPLASLMKLLPSGRDFTKLLIAAPSASSVFACNAPTYRPSCFATVNDAR